jgi:hypothetical protein
MVVVWNLFVVLVLFCSSVRWLELKVAASQQVWEVTGSIAYVQKALNK